MKNILLIGMPGSGKTTIGKLLSQKLDMKFVDMDDYIVSMENKSIADMFEISEEYFRNAESKCSQILAGKSSIIIATGGGIVKRKENMEHLRESSLIVFLNRPVDNILSDINISTRPLLKEGKDKIFDLYNERLALYKKYCHLEVLNNKTMNDAVNEIVKYNKLFR